jgi:hypothetical protein
LSNLYYIKIDLDKDKVVNESFDKESLTNGGTKFRTLEEWEALPKTKLYNGHKLKLTRISINFEL